MGGCCQSREDNLARRRADNAERRRRRAAEINRSRGVNSRAAYGLDPEVEEDDDYEDGDIEAFSSSDSENRSGSDPTPPRSGKRKKSRGSNADSHNNSGSTGYSSNSKDRRKSRSRHHPSSKDKRGGRNDAGGSATSYDRKTVAAAIDMSTATTTDVIATSNWAKMVMNPESRDEHASVKGNTEQDDEGSSLARHHSGSSPQQHVFGDLQVVEASSSVASSGRAEQDMGATRSTTGAGGQSAFGDSYSLFSHTNTNTASATSETLLRRQQRLEMSLERRHSEGRLATEPGAIAEQLKQKAIVAKARLLSGITSDVDQFRDNIDAETKRYLRVAPERVLRICEWVDLVIETMLDFHSNASPHESSSHGDAFSISDARSDLLGIGEDAASSAVPTHPADMNSVSSRRSSMASFSDHHHSSIRSTSGGARDGIQGLQISARHSLGPGSSNPQLQTLLAGGSHHLTPSAGSGMDFRVLHTTLKVGEYDVQLTTAGLVSPDYVPMMVQVRDPPSRSPRQSSTASSHSANFSPNHRGVPRLSSGTGSGSVMSPAPQTMSLPFQVASNNDPHPSATVDEVDQLIFGH